MGVEVTGDIRVRDGDLGVDLLVQQLVCCQRAAKVVFDIIDCAVRSLQSGLKLFLGERGLHFGKLCVDLVVAGREIQLCGALLDDLRIDQLTQNVKTNCVTLILRGDLLPRAIGQLKVVDSVYVGTLDGMTIDCGDHALLRAFGAAGGDHRCGQQHSGRKTSSSGIRHGEEAFLDASTAREIQCSSVYRMGRSYVEERYSASPCQLIRPCPSAAVASDSGTCRKRLRRRCKGNSTA